MTVTATAGWRTAVRRELAIDRAGWQPVAALRAAAGVGTPLIVGLIAGDLTAGVIAGAGALPAGVAGYSGIRSRWGLVLLTTVGMTVSTFLGSLVAGHTISRLIVIAIYGFIAGVAVSLGRSATLVGTQAVIGLVVFGRFPGSFATAAGHAGLVAAGGGLQTLLIGIRPPRRFPVERRAVSHALAQLAAQAHGVAASPVGPGAGAASGAAIAEANELVSRRIETHDVELLRGLVDEAGRVRLELSSLITVRELDLVVEAAGAAAAWLRRLSQALTQDEAPTPDDGRLAATVERMTAARDTASGSSVVAVRFALARTQALLGQLRALDRQAEAISGLRRISLPPVLAAPTPTALQLGNRVAGMGRRLRLAATDRTSTAFRHAIRLMLTLVATDIVADVAPWQRAYWVTLTAVVVLKPDYSATLQRGIARVGGSLVGVLAAGLLVDGLHPPESIEVALIVVLAWATYASFAASYAVYSTTISALVVLLLSPTGVGSVSTAFDRGLSTLVGGTMAMIAVVLWPSWSGSELPASLSELFSSLSRYADVVLGGHRDGGEPDRRVLAAAADAARRTRASAQAAMDKAAAEPARVATDRATAAGLLAAGSRIVIVLHALRATLEDTNVPLGLPDVEPMRAAIVDALNRLATAADGPGILVIGLREEHARLVAIARDPSVAGPHDQLRARRLALLAAQLDPLVDSIDTAAHLLGPVART